MFTQEWQELKNLSKSECVIREKELHLQLFKARMQKVRGDLKDYKTLWKLRKKVARLKTLQTQLSLRESKEVK